MPRRRPEPGHYGKRTTPAQFAESGLVGPSRRVHINVYAPTARIGRILAKELNLPVAIFWQYAAKTMLDKVSESRKRMGDNPLPPPEAFFIDHIDRVPTGPYMKNVFELVAEAAEKLRRGEALE